MKSRHLGNHLAVCSWSLQPTSPLDLVQKLAKAGLRRVQLALDPLRESRPIWGKTDQVFRDHGIEIISGMVACLGEDYSTLESIRLTGGIAPDATWKPNLKNFAIAAAQARELGLKLVTFHAGFLPPDAAHPSFRKMTRRLAAVGDLFMEQGVMLGLETGQETAPELAALLTKLNHPNIGVNFDPANMILYGKGDPGQALHTLAPWVRQMHIKDARRTKVPGTWGQEVPAGKGDVKWRAFFASFKHVVHNLNLVIEREQGDQRVADIRTARRVVQQTYF